MPQGLEEVKESDNVNLEQSLEKKRELTSADRLKEALQDDELEESDDERVAASNTTSFNLK